MEPLYWRKKAVLAKKEATYGVDAVPTGANAIRAQDLSISPIEGQTLQRAAVSPYMGASAARLVGKFVKVDFAVEAAGSGTAGTAPAYADLLKACGMAEIITPGAEVEYQTVHGNFDSLSLYVNVDSVRHVLRGARGTWSFDLAGSQIPLFKFSFVGLFTLPSADALPAVNYAAYQDPLEPTEANTPTVLIHGYAPVLVSANFALNANPKLIVRANKEWVGITDHPVSGEMVIEEPPLATKDFYTAAAGHMLDAVKIVHGTAAGNIVEIGGPKAQITRISKGQADDITTLTLGLSLTNEAAGEDVFIIFK